jgi:hypothetical protein
LGVTLATIRSRTFCLPVCCKKENIKKNIILPVLLCGCKTWSLSCPLSSVGA